MRGSRCKGKAIAAAAAGGLLLLAGRTAYSQAGESVSIARGGEEDAMAEDRTLLTWFCDEPLWQPEEWDTEGDTGTGRITARTGVEISYIVPEDNGDSRLSLMMIQKDMPDIVSVSDSKMLRYLIESDQVWDMEELMETYLPDIQLEYPQDIKDKQMERDGGWYGICSDLHSPDNQIKYGSTDAFYREYQECASDLGVIWNRALLRRLGIHTDGVRTEADIIQLFSQVSEREMRVNAKPVIPLLVDGTDYQDTTLEALYRCFGAVSLDESGAFQERLETVEGKHAVGFLNQMVREGYMEPDEFLMNHYTVSRTLNSGRVLCFMGDIRHSGIDPAQWVSSGAVLSDDGTKPVRLEWEGVSCGEMTTLISKSCEHPEQAARWLAYMTAEEGMYAYLDSCGDGAWWPLRNEDWYYSVQRQPDTTERAWKQLLCAYSRLPSTSTRRVSGDYGISKEALLEKERESSREGKEWINTLIMAGTPEEFDAKYEQYKNREP